MILTQRLFDAQNYCIDCLRHKRVTIGFNHNPNQKLGAGWTHQNPTRAIHLSLNSGQISL